MEILTRNQKYPLPDFHIDQVFAQNIREYSLTDAERDFVWNKVVSFGHCYGKEELESWIKQSRKITYMRR